MTKTFLLKVYRGVPHKQFWEEYELENRPLYNVTSALMEIQKTPLTRQKQRVSPVVWEQGCLEEVCGSCTMLVNGRPRQACTALIGPLLQASGGQTVTLAPLTKYPLIRDLVVNRDAMFQSLAQVRAWVDVDDTLDRGFGPKVSPATQEIRYTLSTCMTCGCCMEACPQLNAHSKFIGPAPISQARLFNIHPVGKQMAPHRNRALMQEGGVSDCGNAQNCQAVCPKQIPLTESIAAMGRAVSKQSLRDLFSLSDVD